MRDIIDEPLADDDGDFMYSSSDESSSPVQSGASTAIMGFRSLSHSLREYHPLLPRSVALFEVFKENIAPLVRIFHMPSLINVFWDSVVSLDTLDKDTEALLFAIYYSAVVSLEPDSCYRIIGVAKPSTQETLRFAVEQALARADLLNTQSMVLLQAAVLFLMVLRRDDDTRTVWSLTALIFHIAQAMGLHHDGTMFGLTPFETELRRRLWWQICVLDSRSTMYHGCEPIVPESAFDTRLPLNINDSDLNHEMREPPMEREGTTDMTFCLILCEIMQTGWRAGYVPPSVGTDWQYKGFRDREVFVQTFQQRLQDRYLKHFDTSVPILKLTMAIARIMMARLWLTVHYPVSPGEEVKLSQETRDQLFAEMVVAMDECSNQVTEPCVWKWSWHCKTYPNWSSRSIPCCHD